MANVDVNIEIIIILTREEAGELNRALVERMPSNFEVDKVLNEIQNELALDL